METFDEDRLRSQLSNIQFARQVRQLCDAVGYDPARLAEDLAAVCTLYRGLSQQPVSKMSDVSEIVYGGLIGVLTLTMNVVANQQERMLGLQRRWSDLYGRLSTLWSTIDRTDMRPIVGGPVADAIAERNMDPADPSIAMHSLYAALMTAEPHRLQRMRTHFEAGMEVRHGPNFVDIKMEEP